MGRSLPVTAAQASGEHARLDPAFRPASYPVRTTLVGVAVAPSGINDELNVTEAWQVISERLSSTVSRYVRFVAPGMGEPLRSHT